RSAAAAAMAHPRWPSPRTMVCMCGVLTRGWDLGRVRGTTKHRGHRSVAAALEPPFPGGPGSSSLDAPSEPQGPCLPAGPPELLLRFLGEVTAEHLRTIRILHGSFQLIRAGGCGAP